MTKKFVRSEWDNTMGGERIIGNMRNNELIPSMPLLDHLESIEDRIGELEKNDSILQEKLEKRLEDIRSRETNFQLWMNDLVGKIERLDTKIRKGCCDVDPTDAIDNCKHDIKKLEQENKDIWQQIWASGDLGENRNPSKDDLNRGLHALNGLINRFIKEAEKDL